MFNKYTNWVHKNCKFAKRSIVYHASATGYDNENLHSFKNEGVKLDKNMGMGAEQGNGLYLFSNFEAAKEYALFLTKTGWHKDTKNGWAMIMSFNVNLNPRDFRLDTELSPKLTLNLVQALVPLIRQIGTIDIGHGPANLSDIFVKDNRIQSTLGHKIERYDFKTKQTRIEPITPVVLYWAEDYNTQQATEINMLLKAVKDKFPQEYVKLSRPFIKNLDRPELRSKFVYTGQEGLKPFKIIALVAGEWQDVTNQDPISLDEFLKTHEIDNSDYPEDYYEPEPDFDEPQEPWLRQDKTPDTSMQGVKWKKKELRPIPQIKTKEIYDPNVVPF